MRTWPFPASDEMPVRPSATARPGHGTRLTANAAGFAYSAAPSRSVFDHPFRPALGPLGVVLRRGLIENLEPRIGKVPISGDAKRGQPVLALEAAVANARGESWVCAELVIDGALHAPKKETWPQIVHRNDPRSVDPLLARVALALVVWQRGRPWRVVPAVYFNLRYARVVLPPGQGPVRHLFF